MANKYAITGGGNWSGATWATASNQAVSDTTKPVAGDVAYMDQYSGSVTVDQISACTSINQTGFVNNFVVNYPITLNGGTAHIFAGNWSGTGTPTYTGGGISITTATVSVNAVNCTINGDVYMTGFNQLTYNGGVNTKWAAFSMSAGNLSLNTDMYVTNLGVATSIWNSKIIYVSGSLTGATYAGNLGSPAIYMTGTGNIPVLTIGCNLTIDTLGTITWATGVYTFPNPTGNKTIKYVKGTILNIENVILTCGLDGILDTNGMKWGTIRFGNGSLTLNLVSNLQCGNFEFNISGTGTITGADVTADNFIIYNKAAVKFQSGRTLNVNKFYMSGVEGIVTSLVSATPSSVFYINYTGTEDNYVISLATLTDVTFTSARKMKNWWGTHTRVTNCDIVNTNNLSLTQLN